MKKRFSLINSVQPDEWHEIVEEALRPFGTLDRLQAEEAVNKVVERGYDAVILDVSSVKELRLFISRLHAQRPEMTIVVAAAAPTWDLARRVFRAGAADCIPRLEKADELRAVLAGILAKQPTPRFWPSSSSDLPESRAPILLADNQIGYLNAWQETLEQNGYTVLPAATLAEAERILKRKDVVLAIIDMRLENDDLEKDVSGLRLAQRASPTVSKIVLTRFPNYEAAREAMVPPTSGRRAAIEFVDKREREDAILATVNRVADMAEYRLESSAPRWRQRSTALAVAALLLAMGASVVAITTGDPRWLLGTVALVILVVVAVGLSTH